MARKFTFTFLFWMLILSVSIAQNVTTDTSTVHSSLKARKYKIVIGARSVIVANSLDSLRGNVLYVSRNKKQHKVSLEVIQALLVAKEKRPVWRGLRIGAVAGFGFGALFGLITYKKPAANGYFTIDLGPGVSTIGGAVAGSLTGVLSGTIIGASSNRFTHYNFSTVPPDERAAFATRILRGK